MIKVLFTCALGSKSEKLFMEIKEDFKKKIEIVCVDQKKPKNKNFPFKFYQVSNTSDKEFETKIFNIFKNEKIDILFAYSIKELNTLSKNKKRFSKINTKLYINDFYINKIFNDKYKTYNLLRKKKFEVPKFQLLNKKKQFSKILKKFSYPKKSVILKSRFGIGGRGTYLICGKDQKEFGWYGQFQSREKKIFRISKKFIRTKIVPAQTIIMEALSKPAYDVDILHLKKKFDAVIRERKNPSGLPYKGSKIIINNKLKNLCKKIVQRLNLKYIIDIDLMTHPKSKKPMILEINPRPSGSILDSHLSGKKLITNAIKLLR